jgi:glycosyltransferase involved in cell wall biosynthesis
VRHEFPVKLIIFGAGPLAQEWRQYTTELDLAGMVTFRGNCAAADIVAQLQQSHVLCLPSVRESGGAVLLEAMACARPVLTVAFGGPAEIVDDKVGRAVPPTGPEEVTEALAHALRDIVHDPHAWRQRGEEGRQRAEQYYGWERKIDQALALYGRLLNQPLSDRRDASRRNEVMFLENLPCPPVKKDEPETALFSKACPELGEGRVVRSAGGFVSREERS